MEEDRPLRLRITPRAWGHLADIESYIARDRPIAANGVISRIEESIAFLPEFPGVGHAGRKRGTLEWVVPGLPYIVIYLLRPATLEVVGIYHGARKRRN